jgi:carboxyl-terminal processing protease
MKSWKKIALPFLFAIALALGIIIGNFFALRSNIGGALGLFRSLGLDKSKLSEVINLIGTRYVDSINVSDLTDNAMSNLLADLDPHSVYIPAKDAEAVNEDLQGSFSGIGVEFNIQKDTILVLSVIPGGPAEKVGMLAGDRIVSVNDSAFVGKIVTNENAIHKLKGPLGTVVKVGVRRAGRRNILRYAIKRDEIPVNTVVATYMIAPKTGYIKVTKFGETTYSEFLTGLAKLRKEGASSLVIDLRHNGGGYMEAAIKMVNEFLPKDQLIVYASGRAYTRSDFYSDGRGSFPSMKIAVIIDEGSASASEIFAGAIQDNDRGAIIGRRSFGKGLVQQQFEFSDKSAIRLTVARYYTPSGRCIQKPYQMGKDLNYENDIVNRYLHGELASKDSIKLGKGAKFKTRGGRTVYGGGGIMPDLFVPLDTTGLTPYFRRLADHGTIYQFAIQYSDQHRQQLQKLTTWQALNDYLLSQHVINQLTAFAQSQGIPKHNYYFAISHQLISDLLNAYIIRNIQGDNNYYAMLNQSDVTVRRAVTAVNNR